MYNVTYVLFVLSRISLANEPKNVNVNSVENIHTQVQFKSATANAGLCAHFCVFTNFLKSRNKMKSTEVQTLGTLRMHGTAN